MSIMSFFYLSVKSIECSSPTRVVNILRNSIIRPTIEYLWRKEQSKEMERDGTRKESKVKREGRGREKSHHQRKEAAGSQIAMKPGTDASRGFRMTTRPPMTMLFFFRPEYYSSSLTIQTSIFRGNCKPNYVYGVILFFP